MKILSNEMARNYQIASLNRGHLIFTSFISKNGRILFLDSHIERLLKGADFLFPEQDWVMVHQKLKRHVQEEFEMNPADSYFRLTLFDDCVHLEKRALEPSVEILKVTSALKIKTPDLIPSFLKISNYLEADLEVARAKFKGFDDVLFFDNDGYLTEASTSNVFVVTASGTIKTPPVSSLVLEGITRQMLMAQLKQEGIAIQEAVIPKAELEKAREIWLTNSVKGVRFVSQFEDKHFERSNSVFEKALALFGRYGELV